MAELVGNIPSPQKHKHWKGTEVTIGHHPSLICFELIGGNIPFPYRVFILIYVEVLNILFVLILFLVKL